MSNMNVIILRGISGAGKSTYIETVIEKARLQVPTVCSADDFFVNCQTGEYVFDFYKLKDAHNQCWENFRRALKSSDPLIVVDNTNTRIWEMQKYIQEAERCGYIVTVIRLVCDPKIAAARNRHRVPSETIQAMMDRFENYTGEIIIDNNPMIESGTL